MTICEGQRAAARDARAANRQKNSAGREPALFSEEEFYFNISVSSGFIASAQSW